jgi:hypothetical protein
MKLSRHPGSADEAPPSAAAPGRFDGLIGAHLDDDERPSREDRDYGQTIFTRPPVKLPKFLRGKRER